MATASNITTAAILLHFGWPKLPTMHRGVCSGDSQQHYQICCSGGWADIPLGLTEVAHCAQPVLLGCFQGWLPPLWNEARQNCWRPYTPEQAGLGQQQRPDSTGAETDGYDTQEASSNKIPRSACISTQKHSKPACNPSSAAVARLMHDTSKRLVSCQHPTSLHGVV